MMANKPIILAVVAILLTSACAKKIDQPASRSFYMGVTPWPADFTITEVDKAYQFINDHCDIVSQHFDDGIPYEEFYAQLALPADFINDVNFRVAKTPNGKKSFLSVSVLNLTRKEKAVYYAKSTLHDSIKTKWNNFSFDDPRVITAYTNYLNWLIDRFKPEIVNYGVESNLLIWEPSKFLSYKRFLSAVYSNLKNTHTGVKFFVSFMVDESNESLNFAKELLPYTDWIALSSYPYLTISSASNGNTDPSRFPANYYERFIQLDLSKPLAFAETGYIAENLVVPTEGINKQGSENWQANYLQQVLDLSNKYNAKLFIWFCNKDYDEGNNRLRQLGLYQTIFGFWEDTGLIDENDRKRPAFEVWKRWMNLKKR